MYFALRETSKTDWPTILFLKVRTEGFSIVLSQETLALTISPPHYRWLTPPSISQITDYCFNFW